LLHQNFLGEKSVKREKKKCVKIKEVEIQKSYKPEKPESP
jgi:hypothetical protein